MFRRRLPTTDLTDEALMQHIARGSESAFNELYRRYGKKMYAHFYRMLNQNEMVAEDFTQQLFMKIIEKPESFDPERRFSTWVFSVAGNMLKNEYRRRARKPEPLSLEKAPNRLELDPFWQQLDAGMWQKHLGVALDQLAEKHRTCFVLRYQEELSIAEISKIVGCPEGTVKSRLYHATRQLAQKLEGVNPLKQ